MLLLVLKVIFALVLCLVEALERSEVKYQHDFFSLANPRKKEPVDFRNVHAASSNWWAGLSTWLAYVLESQLITFGHLLRDRTQLSDELSGMRIEPH
jgi:hypothetical protein